jgi:hypothetical protein
MTSTPVPNERAVTATYLSQAAPETPSNAPKIITASPIRFIFARSSQLPLAIPSRPRHAFATVLAEIDTLDHFIPDERQPDAPSELQASVVTQESPYKPSILMSDMARNVD